uniref:Putative ovule protein n=1 Tax=Solanum chacoense TaxID=4108 RepID=A0A0V0GPG8_SOLCH
MIYYNKRKFHVPSPTNAMTHLKIASFKTLPLLNFVPSQTMTNKVRLKELMFWSPSVCVRRWVGVFFHAC